MHTHLYIHMHALLEMQTLMHADRHVCLLYFECILT